MRTATRRLRTAITIYADQADKKDRNGVEDGLRRVARRLGSVRDLDVLLEVLSTARTADGEAIEPDDLEPLRLAWQKERRTGARRLTAELDRRRFRRTLKEAERLVKTAQSSARGPNDGSAVHRVSGRAPALIWAAVGEVLAFEIDPNTADPAAIHEMRIAAKKLRYTLEAFQDALDPGATLIEEVTALHDAGGEMHDAIVGRDRARSTLGDADLADGERAAIESFAEAQHRRAESRRPIVARSLATVRGRAFRQSLGRAVAAMGRISTGD